MNRMTPDLARLLVAEHLDEAALRRRGLAARTEATPAPEVRRQPQKRGLLSRFVPRIGVRVPTR